MEDLINLFEAIHPPVIRIRHPHTLKTLVKIPHQMQTGLGAGHLGLPLLQSLEIVVVHGYDVVEILEVIQFNLPGNRMQFHTMPTGRFPHPPVGLFPVVKTVGTSAVDVEQFRQSCLFHMSNEVTFGHGRAADVSQAHKQDPDFFLLTHHQIIIRLQFRKIPCQYLAAQVVANVIFDHAHSLVVRSRKFSHPKMGFGPD